MEWQQFAMLWGPAVPLAALLIKAHWDLVYKQIPAHVRSVKKRQRRADKEADRRHAEHVDMMRELIMEVDAIRTRSTTLATSHENKNGAAPRPHRKPKSEPHGT